MIKLYQTIKFSTTKCHTILLPTNGCWGQILNIIFCSWWCKPINWTDCVCNLFLAFLSSFWQHTYQYQNELAPSSKSATPRQTAPATSRNGLRGRNWLFNTLFRNYDITYTWICKLLWFTLIKDSEDGTSVKKF